MKHRPRGIILVFLAAVIGITAVSQTPVLADQADSDFMYAAGFYRTKRWQYSADAFRDFLKAYPEHPRASLARLYYGLSLNSLEQYGEAREQLLAFVKADPENRYVADAKYRIGECSYYLNDYAQAVPQLEGYLKDHAGHGLSSWGQLLLGESLNRLKQYAKAESILRPFLTLPPPPGILADSTYALAEAVHGQKRPEEALPLYQQVADMKSDAFSGKALFRIAGIYFENDDFAKASAIYDRVVSAFGDKDLAASAALQSGVAHYRMKDYEQALVRFQNVAADSEVAHYVGLWKGICLRESGRLDDARTVLASALIEAGDSPLAAEILFHRAQLEVLDGRKEAAAQMYLDLVDRWPQDPVVPKALFNAAELQMELQRYDVADQLLARLQKDFSQQAEHPDVKVLQGRLLLNEGKTEDAVAVLQSAVAAEGGSSHVTLLRNYHLIRALHQARRFEDAIATFEPLQQDFVRPKSSSFYGAIALAALSSLELKQYARAQQFADEFLKLEQDPQKTADALAARAVAFSHLKEFDKAQADLQTLMTNFRDNSQTWMAVLQSAEAAWQQDEYSQAAVLFELVVRHGDKRGLEAALSGAGWSYYRLGKADEAGALFDRIITEFPNSPTAREAAYMKAMGLVQAGKSVAAAKEFVLLFETLHQQHGTAENPEQVTWFLDSGRMAARLLAEAGQVEQADGIWEKLTATFTSSALLEELLDEWARANLQNERYERSDEIYRQLIAKFPNSRYVGAARLSLAESDMHANRLDAALQEFTAIATEEAYAAADKEAALYHVVDIHAAQRDWPDVIRFGEIFATQFGASKHAPMIQLLYCEALLDQKRFAEAHSKLDALRTAVLDKTLVAEEWTERIWIVLAELALAEKRYAEIETIAAELETRTPNSRFLFQMRDVQGRRWKNQAPPDFDRARDYFAQVVQDDVGRGTETAARCQFLIGETLLLQQDYAAAVREYYRVYLNYPFVDLRARALFQAAGCEMKLQKTAEAIRSYQDLINDFPASELAEKSRERLKEIGGEPE